MPTAWIAGASGLVGSSLLHRLLEDAGFSRIVSVGRRPLPLEHPKLVQVVVDFSSPSALHGLDAVEVAFSCLGTTMRKAGSRPAFRAVDHDAVLAFARAARHRGARTFLHVSAIGANPRSPVFYTAVKGQVEDAVARTGIPSVYAFRPSLLEGARAEHRRGERIGLAVGRALGPFLGKYRPTPAEAVAQAMVTCARLPRPGAHVVEADEILALARRAP
jgi:uncharacterized protein YbjT (DUF2867 family)